MNNLYSSVVHADVSREDSKNIRDQYVNQLAPKLQQVSGLDLSLQQNVDTAKGLFTPFYENKKLVRDMVFTKKWKSEMGKAQRMKESDVEATRKQHWDDGVKKLQYDMEDFVGASSEDMMNRALPQYVSKYDIMGEGLAKIKELDPNVQTVSFSENGMWKITMKNGSLLTRQPMGKDKNGEMQYSNPIGDYLSASLLNDPRAIDYYRTKGYVEARSFYDKNKDQYGDKQAGMNAWGDQFIQQYGTEEQKTIAELEQKEGVLKGRTISWKNHIKEYGVTEGSNTDLAVKNTTAEYEATKRSKDIRKDRSRQLNEGPSDNLTKALSMFMSFNMMKDINETANTYASTHGEVDTELSPLAKLDIQHQNSMALEEYKQNNRKLMKLFDYALENPPKEGSSEPPTKQYLQGDDLNSTLIESQYDYSQSTQNDLSFAQELKEDDSTMLDLVTNWFIQENSMAGRTELGAVNLCPSGTCGNDHMTDLKTIKAELAKGNNDLLETAYGVMKSSYGQLMLSENTSAMGKIRGDLLYNTGRGISFLTARDAMHVEGQRLRQEDAMKRYDFIMKKDDGIYTQLVEEADGLNIFRENQDGSITELGKTAFEDAFMNHYYFEDFASEQELQVTGTGLGGMNFSASHSTSLPILNQVTLPTGQKYAKLQGQDELTTMQKAVGMRPNGGMITFDEESARQAAAELYKQMQVQMDAVAADGDGSEASMPSFSLPSWYNSNDQTGSGDNITPWIVGVYDHYETRDNNTGKEQLDFLQSVMRKAVGADMIVDYGTYNTMARVEKGRLEDTNSNADAKSDLDQLYLHLGLSTDAEGKRESRPQLKIKYNTNGPVYTNPDTDEEIRYSVYEVQFDGDYSSHFDQIKEKEGNDAATNAFQRNQHTISVFVPKGKYYNSHDEGKRQHEWQMMLQVQDSNGEGGQNPSVGVPMGGTATVSWENEKYWLTMAYKVFDPDASPPGLVDDLPHTTPLLDASGNSFTDYKQFESLKIHLEHIIQEQAVRNQNAEALHNKTIK